MIGGERMHEQVLLPCSLCRLFHSQIHFANPGFDRDRQGHR